MSVVTPVTPIEALLLSILAAIQENTAAVCALRADLHAVSRKPITDQLAVLSRADRELLARQLPAIGGAYGPEKFSSRDLAEDTRPAVRLVMRGLSVKQISKLFTRAAGIPIDGLMVLRQGFEYGVMTWQIVAEGFQPVGNPATPGAHQVQSAEENLDA